MKGYRQIVPDTVFVYEALRPFRILLVGNCQAGHHAQLARIAFEHCSADYIAVHNASDPARAADVEAFFNSPEARYDLVIAFTLHEKWGAVSREALENRFGRDRVFYIPNLIFEGLQPDMISIGELGARIAGPLGDYHSRIAVGAWLMGADLAATLKLFTGQGFERLGYFARFAASLEEFRQRERSTDMTFGDVLLREVRNHVSFFTLNHPTPTLFSAFMQELRERVVSTGRARSSGVPMDPCLVAQSLIESGVAPIFPEIAEAAGLAHRGGRSYLVPRQGGGVPLSLEEFLVGSFETYERVGRDALLETAKGKASLASLQTVL